MNEETPAAYGNSESHRSRGAEIMRWLSLSLSLIALWAGASTFFILRGPGAMYVNDVLDAIADELGVSFVFLQGVIWSVFVGWGIAAAVYVASRPAFRRSLRLLFSSEKSFHTRPLGASASIGSHSSALDSFAERLKLLERKVDGGVGSIEMHRSVTESDELLKKISDRIAEDVGDEAIKVFASGRMHELEDISLSRLSNQVVVLGRRATISLIFGLLSGIVGFCVIFWILRSSNYDVIGTTGDFNIVAVAQWYLPRIGLILLAEVISFFFLRLYRSTLVEIKYVQNEITNIEMRLISLHAARTVDEGNVAAVIGKLADTERNGVISKGQTTVEIEMQKAAREGYAAVVEALTKLTNKQ